MSNHGAGGHEARDVADFWKAYLAGWLFSIQQGALLGVRGGYVTFACISSVSISLRDMVSFDMRYEDVNKNIPRKSDSNTA